MELRHLPIPEHQACSPWRLTACARHAQVGAATALSARAVWRFSDKSSVRAVARVGTSGIEVELGGAQRVSEFSTAGLGVSVGLMVQSLTKTYPPQGNMHVRLSRCRRCSSQGCCMLRPFSQ